MGQVYDGVDDALEQFLTTQPVYFVATAPLAADGHVNLSPKGFDSFRVLNPTTVCWLDLVGSGVETIAHLRENGRMTLMFCAFEGPPRIVRLHGRGEAILPSGAGFADLAARFPARPNTRSVVVMDIERVADSCGYGVPRMDFVSERTQMAAWARAKGADGIEAYKAERNAVSLDGLPGLG